MKSQPQESHSGDIFLTHIRYNLFLEVLVHQQDIQGTVFVLFCFWIFLSSYIYFHNIFHCRVLKDIDYSSLYYTVNPCFFFNLCNM